MGDGTIQIDRRQLGALKRVAGRLEKVESQVGFDRAAEIAGDIQQAVDRILQNREQISKFFRLTDEETASLGQGLETVSGLAGGFGRGFEIGRLTKNPIIGAVAAVVFSLIGGAIGFTLEDRRREIRAALQEQQNEEFRFSQGLREATEGFKRQSEVIKEFSRQEAARHRLRSS